MGHDPLVIGAIAAVATAGNTVLLGVALSPQLIVAAFAGAALVYWGDRVLGFSPEDAYAHPDRVDWVETYRRWLYVEGVGLAVMLAVSVPFLAHRTIAVAAACGMLGAVHVLPVLPGRRRMKAMGRGQALTIALAWAAGGVVGPWVEAGAGTDAGPDVSLVAVGGVCLAQFFLVYANVVVAGWADRQADEQAGMPVGKAKAGTTVRRYALGAAVTGGLLVVVMSAAGLPVMLCVGYAMGTLGISVLIVHLRPQEKPYHMLWLDLAVALPGAFVLIGRGLGV